MQQAAPQKVPIPTLQIDMDGNEIENTTPREHFQPLDFIEVKNK